MIIDSDDAAELQAALALSLGESVPETTVSNVSFGEGFPADFTGQYELHSIVSHKGRSADSGHYIGWVRQAPGSSAWWKFNDNVVTETTMEEILMLKGGADRDSAYLAFYRVKNMS